MIPNQIIPSTPALTPLGYPYWYHNGGDEVIYIGMKAANAPSRVFLLKSKSVELFIYKDWASPQQEESWMVKYHIKHPLIPTYTEGLVLMTTQELKTAFGLSGDCDADYGQGVIDVCGGDVAKEGTYLRFQEYLNIPGPGYGRDGDPNISIRVGKGTKNALGEFLDLFRNID